MNLIKAYALLLLGLAFVSMQIASAQSTNPEKSFDQKLEGIRVSEKELTKSASTDNSSIGQGGAMSTSIPLVTVKARSLSFPLQLNYTAGIKVDQKSGPVGLGWVMPVGSIVRDYGAFEPDYSSTKGELEMINSNGGTQGWLNPDGSPINPSTHNEVLGYETSIDLPNLTMPLSDKYHMSVPGFGGNTFWNGGAIGSSHDWKWSEFERWRVEHTIHTYEIDQEYSRINEFNRFDCPNCDNSKDYFGTTGSYAAAIGVFPYVENGYATLPSSVPLSPEKVKYEDFETFTVTDDNGVVYVFGRPLRGQKFVFSDNPYWSTSPNTTYYNQVVTDGQGGIISTPPSFSPKGNFWKVDYIAEWLLTEIHSPDYKDLNNNGIADDEDAGDWIRFEYTEATQIALSIPLGNGLSLESGGALATTVPKHREWSSFSQTDQASSLMRERAYLTKVITPLEEIDFTISQRMDIDHDFLDKPANKKGSAFYYEDRKCSSSGSTGSVNDFDIKYPVETMKYDSIKVFSRLIDAKNYPLENTLTGAIVLKYADKGSPEELAVSDYTLRNNDNTAKLNPDGTHLGTPTPRPFENDRFDAEKCFGGDKRGKTTLLAVEFLGGDLNQDEKTSYEFGYAYNPSFSEIHKREILRKWTRPNIRKSGSTPNDENLKATLPIEDYVELVMNPDGTSYSTQAWTELHPSDFLIDVPYAENKYKFDKQALANPAQQSESFIANGTDPYSVSYGIEVEPVDHFLQPIKDQFGFLYSQNYAEASKAWSLTSIKYPTGGIVSFEYEPAPYDGSSDESNWSFKHDEIPLIKEYNDLAKKRSLTQSMYNIYSDPSYIGTVHQDDYKTLTATIELELPSTYGIRLKKKITDDRINPQVEINYEYGTAHFTSLPSEFLATYLGVYTNFLIREDLRHLRERSLYENSLVYDDATGDPTGFVNDFRKTMAQVGISNITLDDYKSVFFHEYVDSRLIDNSYTRTHYTTISGDINDAYDNRYFLQVIRAASGTLNNRYALGGNPSWSEPIAVTKKEMFDATEVLPYQIETWDYDRHTIDSRELAFDYSPFSNGGNNFIVWQDADGFENWVPIWIHGLTPLNVGGTFDLGPFNTPNILMTNGGWVNVAGIQGGYSFVFDDDHFLNESMTIFENSGMYLKWNTTKTLLTKHETNYKGLLTTRESVYDPSEFYLTQEKVNGSYTEEKYITTYEYAFETYGPNNLFLQKNMLNVPTRVNKYLDLDPNSDPIFPSTAISASATTFDLTNFSIPRALNTFQFETDVLSAIGTFNLVDFDYSSTNNPNWRIDQNDNIEYNKTGQLISSRANRLFSKTVFGNNINIQKALIAHPYEAFDATYSGFEDFSGRHNIVDWTSQDYKQEDWFVFDLPIAPINSIILGLTGQDICGNGTVGNTASGYYHIVSVDDPQVDVGSQVTLNFETNYNGVQTVFNNLEVTQVYLKSDIDQQGIFVSPTVDDYLLCFSAPVDFPFDNPANSGNEDPLLPENDYIISGEFKQVKYNLSKTYARTGKYSYKLPTIKDASESPNKTAVRPVKLTSAPPSSDCTEHPVVSETTDECNFVYEASVWLKYDSDITSIGGGGGATPKSADILGDVTYQRGTVSETDNQQGVKIICDVYNSDRSAFIQEVFYVNDLNADWKQYTVSLNIPRGNKWLDVYVQNEREQIGATIPEYKSVFADDIIIYPAGAKYSYTTYDKFGNETFVTNNNDVFTESVFDEKGRPVLQKNAYGTMVSEQEYFEDPNWSNQVNHVTERNWVSNGIYNESRYYLDGFGKTKQMMVADHARNARVVTESNYFNDKGFATATFKPYALIGSTLGDNYDTDFIFNVQDLYSSSNALTEVTYEAKPEMKVSTMSPPRENSETPIIASQQDYVSTAPLFASYGTTALTQNYPIGSLLVHEVTDANGNVTKTYMDNLGRVIMEEHPIGEDHVQNADGSITMTTGNAVARTWFVYDPEGRLIKVVDPSGKESTYEYNSLGVVVKKTTADKGTSELRYDKYGQIRFVRDQKDINATNGNTFSTDQFAYWKYDEWGRVTETGQKQAAPSQPSFTGQLFFDDYSKIDDQEFPLTTEPLVELHQSFEYDGSRDQFNSDATLCEKVNHDHVVNGDLTISAQTEDEKCYNYMADGQVATVTYNYQGLDEHIISYSYNDVRIPTGKRYTHPTESGYNFEWRTNIDNFARPQTNVSTWNGVETQTGQYYYDVLGNLLAKGLGTTGNTADPHLDYHFFKFDIRDQLTHHTSKHFRFGLKHDSQGNITDQYWSNEFFDPSVGGNANINQYHYYYDDMNRLIGADYRQGTESENPFANFDQLFGSIPNDFLCGVNNIAVDEYMEPVFVEFQDNIDNGINPDQSTEAINGLNVLKVEYKQMDIAYSQMTESEKDVLLTNYLGEMDRGRINQKAYELYRAEQEGDTDHIDAVNDGTMTSSKMKYTKLLLSGLPYNQSVQCDANTNATVYGFLPTFPFPTNVTNNPKYDAAYWYTENGNMTDLNRNDEVGVKTEQDYSYSVVNNRLTSVDWTLGSTQETHTMSYDANGNLLNENFAGTSTISAGSPEGTFVYDDYDELPTSITNDNGTRNYRYDINGQRILKEVDANDKNYYLDGVIVDQNNEVVSYQTSEGYASVSNSGGIVVDYFYSISDWLGTNRAIMDATGNTVNAHDHYPFGKRMPARHMVADAEGNRYQYTGHEFDGETGYGYHGARYYNRELGRYMNVDRYAEKFFNQSPYTYAGDMPINAIDVNGDSIKLYTISEDGRIKFIKTVDHEDEYDMLYRADDWKNKEYYGERLRLDDQNLLGNYSVYGLTSNKEEAFKLFHFAITNTKATEWGLAGYKSGESIKYAFISGSATGVDAFPLVDIKMGVTNKVFDLHSHPKPKGAMTYLNGADVSGGDYSRYRIQKEKFDEAGKRMPKYYMIYAKTNVVKSYYSKARDVNFFDRLGVANSYKTLMNLVR